MTCAHATSPYFFSLFFKIAHKHTHKNEATLMRSMLVARRIFASSRQTTLCSSRRWASSPTSSSPASSSFRAGVVKANPFNVGAQTPAWQPGPAWMRYRLVRFLVANATQIATAQLSMELLLTGGFGLLFWARIITRDDVVEHLRAWHYPFMSLIDFDGSVWSNAVHVGPFTLNPEKLTAAHGGHCVAVGLLPLQVLIIALGFRPAQRLVQKMAARRVGGVKPATTSASSSSSSSSAGKPTATTTTKTSSATSRPPPPPRKRASYTINKGGR